MIEPLESRTLLAAPIVGIYTGRPDASETDPSGAGRGSFLVKRAVRTKAPLTVQYSIAGLSTAKNSVDYQTLSGSVTIPANKYSAVVHIIPIDDSIEEGDELVSLAVKTGAYTIGHRRASVNVLDNDDAVSSDWFGDARRYRASFTVNSGPDGGAVTSAPGLQCDSTSPAPPDPVRLPSVGFRCCHTGALPQ